jgi:hypothetical protein
MVRVEPTRGQGEAVQPLRGITPHGIVPHVDAACFGESGMHLQQACAHAPLAAGLFGMSSCTVPVAMRAAKGRA